MGLPRLRQGGACVVDFIHPATCGAKSHGSSSAAAEAAPVLLLQIYPPPAPDGFSGLVGLPYLLPKAGRRQSSFIQHILFKTSYSTHPIQNILRLAIRDAGRVFVLAQLNNELRLPDDTPACDDIRFAAPRLTGRTMLHEPPASRGYTYIIPTTTLGSGPKGILNSNASLTTG